MQRSSHDGTTHGGDYRIVYVAGMFVMYGLVDIMDQGYGCSDGLWGIGWQLWWKTMTYGGGECKALQLSQWMGDMGDLPSELHDVRMSCGWRWARVTKRGYEWTRWAAGHVKCLGSYAMKFGWTNLYTSVGSPGCPDWWAGQRVNWQAGRWPNDM